MIYALYLGVLGIYISLQSQYVFGGDSGEFSTVARTWGISHPPGYPLYSLLINLLNQLLPFGSTSWKISLLSSIPTIITAYCIFKILTELKIHKYIALPSSLLYITLFPVWQNALIPEVFGLHTMLVGLITYLLLRYSKTQNKFLLLCSALLFGLCISNHHIFVLFIPGWFFLLKGKIKKILSNKLFMIQIGSLMFLGISFYLYAVIASFNNTILDWENAKTIQGFLNLITRSSYGSFKAYSNSAANIINQLSDMISGLIFIFIDFKILGILFISLGLYASRKYGKQFTFFILISLALHFVFLFYTNFMLTVSSSSGMYERFLIPLYFILTLLFGVGVDYFFKKYYLTKVLLLNNPILVKLTKVGFYLFIVLFVSLVALQNIKTISTISQENTFEKFGKDIIDTVPKSGILITKGDTPTFVSSYRLYALKERADIVFFQLGLLGKTNYIDLLKKRTPSLIISDGTMSNENFKRFFTDNIKKGYYSEDEMAIGTWRPFGLLWKYYPNTDSASSDSAALLEINKLLWTNKYKIPILSKERKNIFHLSSVYEYYVEAYQNYGKLLVYYEKYAEAEAVLHDILMHYKKNDPQSEVIYMNILVQENKCLEASRIAQKIDFANTIKKYPGFVRPALSYLYTCDPKNVIIPNYQQLLLEYEKNKTTNLNSF